MKLAPKEREYLVRLLSREILWWNIETINSTERGKAESIANTVVRTIEGTTTSASSLKRAVAKVITHLEETA